MNDMPHYPRMTRRGNVYWHRAAVPQDIKGTYPKREETASLRTRDFSEAVKRLRIEAARVDALFDAHREELARLNAPKLPELTPEQIEVIGSAFYAQSLAEDDEERLAGFALDEDFAAYEGDVSAVESIARELYARGRMPGFVTSTYDEITRKLNLDWRLEETSPSWPLIGRAVVKAAIRAAEARKRRNAGEIVDTPPLPKVEVLPVLAVGPTLTDLFDLWKRDHLAAQKSVRTVNDFKHKIDSFISFLGHEDATRVTPKNVADYLSSLQHDRGLSPQTIKGKYLAAIRLVYGIGQEKLVIVDDPSEKAKVRVPKEVRSRKKGFTDDEALRILSCALRDPETLGGMDALNKAACKWVPWICAYTGARGGEITQLRREDFITEHGINCIRLTPDAGSVKMGQFRVVPLHPHLVELGLLDFVNTYSSGPIFYKPTGSANKSGHRQSQSVLGKVSGWVRKVAGVTDPRLQPNHAWRHRFKTIARDVDIPQRYMDAIQGHDDGSSSADYGENTMKALYREVQKLPRYEVTGA